MECREDMEVPKRHSQFSNNKYKWRTAYIVLLFVSGCSGQDLIGSDPYILNKSSSWTELEGGILTGGRTVWRTDGNPYLIREDVLIERDAELVVEPGVVVRFAPMVGITVRGKLLAVGRQHSSILFTSTEEPVKPVKTIPDIRLVDGPSILAGRVQLLHKGQWRSVCTNSRNWTVSDMETACRQLGFMGGTFYNWVDRQPGRHARLLYEEPKCKGTEYDMFQCDWNSRQLGSGVCDYHPDLAIQCSPHHDDNELRSSGIHWRGIRFENAVYERILTAVNTLYVPTSMSRIEHVTIKNAGLGRDNNASSAIDVIGVPPIMESIEVSNSAFNAINVTSPNAPIVINNCTIQNNRGYGVYVNSTYGMAKIENCLINDNGGDGVKYVVHELHIDEKFDRSEIFDLCTLASTPSQTFPIQMSIEQSRYSNMERDCSQKFYTRSDHVLTLSFLKMMTNRNNTGEIFIFDGLSSDDKLLLSFSIRNYTRPQSVTSTRNRMYVQFKANTRTDIVGFLRLTSGVSKTYDLNVTDTIISDNNGRGVAIENLRSQVHIHRTSISNNNHVAGLHVVSGAGDVNVTESRISFNQGDGINITVTGGNRNISRSIISSNQGYGMAVWINNTKETEYVPVNQTTVVEYSEVFKNLKIGVLHGNFCGDSWVNITGNGFNTSIESAIEIITCWRPLNEPTLLHLQIGHNKFYQNQKVPLKIQPALNVNGRIEYNYFEHGDYGAIIILNRIDGKYIEEFEIIPARFNIQHNYFSGNKGPFVVNFGLSPYSDIQYILFARNFLRDNKIKEPFEQLDGYVSRLTPRSRVAAAIVLASSNIDVFRNIIHNPEAQYEIGSHVEDQSKILNCTFNWLGYAEEERVYNRLFHRKDRYNLAKIIYMPYLLHNSNPGATQINYNSLYVPHFNTPGSFLVGGEVEGVEILKQGEYDVTKDINIRPGGKLVLQPGVTLKFPPTIGIMVAGKLEARGKRPNDIRFTLKEEVIMTNDSIYETDENETEMDHTTPGYVEPLVPIRLLGGRTQHEGRLQVRINEKWGTVCNYKWNIVNAALVCHQLGLVLNPDDWFLEPSEIPAAGMNEDIILSNVECTEFDTEITRCKAETVDNFENSCSHENDVGVRCHDTSWSGIRFSVIAERSDLQFVSIEKAGLLDYSSNLFKPALQIDFARHSLERVKIANNYHDGLGILYSDLYGADAINTVKDCEFSNNKGSGISFKQLGLKVYGSVIENNDLAGISHNPHITGQQQREIAGWFNLDPGLNMDEANYHPILLPEYETDISLVNGETRHLVFTKHYGENIVKSYNIKCNPGYVLGLQLLNPIHNFSTEQICIYDSQNINEGSTKWCLDKDLSVFPTTSGSFGVVLTYNSGNKALGGVVLVVSTIVAPVQNLRNKIIKGPVPVLQIVNSKIKGNTKGIKALYYNRYLNEIGDHFLRKANESIKIFNCEIAHNKEEAIFVNTPFWDIHESNITEITIMINNSLITDNGKGIYHFARDLRSSNNLYHYYLQDNTIERNKFGGFDVSLPYVWQYNENFTHSVFMYNNTWRNNLNFGLVIDGHFAEVNVTKNILTENVCKAGLISIRGMEKKIKVDGNLIERNNGRFMIEFHMDSQSEIMGLVYAVFIYNQVKNNKQGSQLNRGALIRSIEPTYVIGFKGIQKIKVSRNLFGNNELQYTLLAGIKTAKINNLLDITENWWGSNNEKTIKTLIFDFDDWNNHAIATYLPYLLEDNFDSSLSVSFSPEKVVDINELGGRLTTDLVLESRIAPYIINADITVMPDVNLIIHPGVILEFSPNVGILVMGTLKAIGHSQLPIVMRPISQSPNTEVNHISKREIRQYHHKYRRQLESLATQDSIRLCTGKNCSINNYNIKKKNEGFLEYYNKTTLQWVPMCDNRFTERNAQVVCRELGFDPINVFFARDRRVEYHSNSLSRIWSWPEPLQCVGSEEHYDDCPIRLNGQLYGHRHECKWDSEFVFIHCGERNLKDNMEYWGGIRFANPEFEYSLYEHRIHDHHTHETMRKVESELDHVHIYGAGILHNEKSPAIQSILKNPRIHNVNITKCAHHGVNLVSPTDSINMMFNTIDDVLGEGISAISLTGEGRESDESSFTPLKDLNLPYNLFSLVDICDSSKVITVEEKVLLYYKYDNNPVNCVKIFKSMFRVKPFGFRLLQFNLFNHTKNYGKRDSITLYDGDIYNVTAPQIAYIENDSLNEKKLFKTEGPSLSVKLFANGASAVYGFIAEVVTLPISSIAFSRDVQHNISNSEFTRNRDGAINYQSVGEVNPLVSIARCEFTDNCLKLYGNFTTCLGPVRIDVQNTQTLVFRNNLVRKNVGGLSLRADSRGSATSLRGWIHNNLFYANHDLPTLIVEGRQSTPYQEVTIYRNYFARHRALYKDVIVLRQVVSNFTYNYVHDNTGLRILEVSGFDKVRQAIYQTTSHNGFYKNYAIDRECRATVVAGTGGQNYIDNIFFNPDNDYEMITVNKSIFLDYNPNSVSVLELWRTKIDAKHNYWSYNESLAVAGRIRDQSDNPMLLEVDYKPYYMNNLTILGGGKCPPGWDIVAGTCYMYVGAPMTYEEARQFCTSDNASMPYVSGNYGALYDFIQRQNLGYQFGERVWVNHIDYVTQCTSFSFSSVEITNCNQKNPFICEIDPKITIDPMSWRGDLLAVGFIGILALAVLLVAAALVCWYSKSKHRHIQRLERRNSIRQSLHSVRSIGSINGGFPDTAYRRKLAQMSTRSTETLTKGSDYRKMLASTTSMESMEKSQFNSSIDDTQSFDIYEAHHPHNVIQLKHSTFIKKPVSPEYSVPQNNNRPYNLAYKNDGYKDSGPASGAPSVTTEEIPIIHHPGGLRSPQDDDTLSPISDSQYFNSDTLPLRDKDSTLDLKRELEREATAGYGAPASYGTQPKLSFLMELRSKMPEPPEPVVMPTSTFGQRKNIADNQQFFEENLPSPPHLPVYSNYANDSPETIPSYDSSPRDYSRSFDSSPTPGIPSRSKSEALLETNFEFDDTESSTLPITEASRSHSQPLETAM